MSADRRIEFVTQKLVSVNVVRMSLVERATAAIWAFGIWNRSWAAKSVRATLTEVSATAVTSTRANVSVKMALRASSVIAVKVAILDFHQAAVKVFINQ